MEDSARLSVGEMFALIGAEVERGVEGLPFPAHVATDSRDVERRGGFVALEGERTDGHRYVPQALEKGAALIVVRRGKRPENPAVPCGNPKPATSRDCTNLQRISLCCCLCLPNI